jgi:hypothetical protein
MVLCIAGVGHFDPAARQRLVKLLRYCSKKCGKPAFIATEWDKNIFEKVIAQRNEFRAAISNQWPSFSAELLNSLTLSLAYEGDSHLEVFPDAEVMWLDEGREAPEEDIKRYARDRFAIYKGWLGDNVSETDESAILEKMRKKAAQQAGIPPSEGTERDAKWADMILRGEAKGGGDWAVIIVGKFHALKYAGSLLDLLEAEKQGCKVVLL